MTRVPEPRRPTPGVAMLDRGDPSVMLLDPHEFTFTLELERGFPIFQREFAAMARTDFLCWPDRAAYGGEWLVAPLFMSSHIAGIEHCFAVNQARCPESTAFLRAIPGVTAAVFSSGGAHGCQ